MTRRSILALATAGALLGFLMSLSAVSSPTAALPPAVGVACLTFFLLASPPTRLTASWAAAMPGAVSLGTTCVVLLTGAELSTRDGLHGLLEVVALFVVLAGVVRWLDGPRLWWCAGLTATAQVAWILRFLPDRSTGALVAGCALWSVPSLVAVVVGGYPRFAAGRLRNSVSAARAEQRRQLERDMHDYVAHDLTGMIVQAQAAQFAGGDDPRRLREALRRIEESGQRAMSSMDRALHLLGDGATDVHSEVRRPGVEGLERLVADYSGPGSPAVDLKVSGNVADLPREVSETLYRLCVEALTNVRRHATAVTCVDVELWVDRHAAELIVENDGRRSTPGKRPRAGSGLRNARARVEALGGELQAAAVGTGWRVRASLPLRVGPHAGGGDAGG